MMGNFGYGGMGWIGMIIGLVISITLIVGLVILIVWAVRRIGGNTTQIASQMGIGQSAKDIAQSRYARGEISREEYLNIISGLAH
ncbi:MAG: hypothetical protein CVU46_10020 [Chloroflexi bacterium HGW-Chloroflexi-8]|nr:MAG: hypothetical protein CVU46_10020 [Chloroflexi bacterium HGW-Chloroflexi-8]